MPSPAAVTALLDSALNQMGPMRRYVYKRVVTRSGDDLTGRTANTYKDTILSPQPYYRQTGKPPELVSGTKIEAAGEYTFILSPSAMTLSDIQNPNVLLVLKNPGSKDTPEILRITRYDTTDLNGVTVVFTLVATSLSR